MLGSLLAVGGSLLGGLLNNQAASARQEDSQAFNAEQFATRYQTTVKDLQAAGLNPMLAYSQGAGSGATSAPAGSSGYGDIGASYTQSKLATAQVANIEADTENKAAQAKLIEAQAAQAWASAGQSNANVGLIEANKNKAIAELENIPKEGVRLDRLAELFYQQANLASQQQLTESQRYDMIKATVAKIKSETKLLDFDVDAASTLENAGRIGKEVKPFFDMLRNILRK